jgi:hypothetical protein
VAMCTATRIERAFILCGLPCLVVKNLHSVEELLRIKDIYLCFERAE